MRLYSPLPDENLMDLSTLSIAPGPAYARRHRSSSYSSSLHSEFTESACSINSSQVYEPDNRDESHHHSHHHESDVNSVGSRYFARLSPRPGVPTAGTTNDVVSPSANGTRTSFRKSRFRQTTDIVEALRELREHRVADHDDVPLDGRVAFAKPRQTTSVTRVRQLVTRLLTRRDLVAFCTGLIAAALHGALWSCLTTQVRAAVAAFAPFDRHDVASSALTLLLISLALAATAWTAHVCLTRTAENLLASFRQQILRHLLVHLPQSWFDVNELTLAALDCTIVTRADAQLMRRGLGPELGALFQFSAQCVTSFVVAFRTRWNVALAITAVASIAVVVLSVRAASKCTRPYQETEADATVHEALTHLRTICALNAQRRVREKHALCLRQTERKRIARHGTQAVLQSAVTGSVWLMSAVGLWYGGTKVYEADATPSEVVATLLGVIMGSHALGNLVSSYGAVLRASSAAFKLFAVLDTLSTGKDRQDESSGQNPLVRPASCSGAIMAVDLHFAYPSRPQRLVLRGCNISLLSGECVAVVGSSGSGKSTLVALLMRLYEPSQGLILLDGCKAQTIDATWMRAQLGVVPQHVTLFQASIFDNIALGDVVHRELTGASTGAVMMERVIRAAKRADVHEFILSLPRGYDSRIEDLTAPKLTILQRQRLALARALIREPKLLLLDEVAISPHELISRFGDTVRAGSTTMLLCTSQVNSAAVQYADKLVVLEAGKIVEQGTHVELLQRGNSAYRQLHLSQFSNHRREQRPAEEPPPLPTCHRHVAKPAPTTPIARTKRDIQALARPERTFLTYGLVASVFLGLCGPLLGLLISEALADMMQQYEAFLESLDTASFADTLRPQVTRCGLFLTAGTLVVMVIQSAQLFFLDAAAERLASHLRDLHFSSLLAQPVPFFDAAEHNPTSLTGLLATQAPAASLIIGRAQGHKVQLECTFAATIAVSFYQGSWMLSLVLIAAVPLLLIGEALHNQRSLNSPLRDELELEEASNIHVREALTNRRAVVMLGLGHSWCSSFDKLLQRPLRHARHEARLEALSRSFSASVLVAAGAIACWLSGVLVRDGDATTRELLHSMVVVLVAVQSSGLAVAWLGQLDGASQAGASILALRDAAIALNEPDSPTSPSSKKSSDGEQQEPLPQSPLLRGGITLEDVRFAYPLRPTVSVLNGLTLHVGAGQTVALCGPRGAGMSTVFALLEKFYTLSAASGDNGRVLLDEVDIRALDVAWLRAQISFVGPEPTLFLGTVAENIAFGMAAPPTLEMIVAAAEVAHAHTFISYLPDAYATQVGGPVQLTPSQRQRIALARAVLQDARLLLLDEPTRSLGAESEKIAVQQALDTIVAQRVRRTTIIAAHPCESATVRNADLIYVLDNGRVVDQGTHAELFQLRGGVYSRLLRESTWSVASSSSYTVNSNPT
ncbi:unnamed protein product [Hyaloperonospora brassicae]|uniref:RxLR effector candidate protein n=1 Tax=Hyaloperonospora brassicae TaxID=162125 RepID=A0AAV0TFT3_HYABA|nr:unnamed protein product [Hyaloperonospora brassicae]